MIVVFILLSCFLLLMAVGSPGYQRKDGFHYGKKHDYYDGDDFL